MSLPDKFDRAFAYLQASVTAGKIPGGVLGFVNAQGQRQTRATGFAQTHPVRREMTENTWFDLASLTKVIFTTTRILDLADQGRIDLDAPLISVLPDLRQYDNGAWERKVTFRQCLGHQTPFPAVEPIYTYGRDPELLRAFILQREWRSGPNVYSDINFILLGLALERLADKTIWQMDAGSGFAFSSEPEATAATEACTWRKRILCGEVHDDNCAALQGAGHAGLFGTVGSVLNFAHDMLAGPNIPKSCLKLMRTPLSDTTTHGWQRPHQDWSGGALCSEQTIGHTGFTGTGLWIDFEQGHAWTLLTNRIHPSRHFDSGIVELRHAVGDTISAR